MRDSDATCPFCGEADFDLIGLKGHLQRGWCEAFNECDREHCEHGVKDGDWCEPCNTEMKRAAADPDNGNGETSGITYPPAFPDQTKIQRRLRT